LNIREIVLFLLVIAFLLRELSQVRQKKWFIQWLSVLLPKPKALQTPKIRQMKPKSEKDSPYCQKEQAGDKSNAGGEACSHGIIPWSEMKKGKGGRPKQSNTEGHACLEPNCYSSGITDQTIHALVANGSHGRREKIGDLTCQACQAGFFSSPQYPALSAQNSIRSCGKSHAAGSTWGGDFCPRRSLSSS
jgi:hypothetical protein